ncbi:MAG TPA: PhzF family phenazine biosynthesis protein [Candidatus Limnocylindrales bacterium]|nr:PhzF family phenazine biosynthesis protein [Candidatus Limnocylindrales bacterium]
MRVPYFQVNAFTNNTFGGNPAGVCILSEWLPDNTLKAIAAENDLSETAFLIQREDFFELRWFTPAIEVDLCGHATLASAFALFFERGHQSDMIRFDTKSGWLSAAKRKGLVELDFPSRPPVRCTAPEQLIRGLGSRPAEVLRSRDYLAVFDSPLEVAGLKPDFGLLRQLDVLGIIATARDKQADFVSRFFAPAAGIDEDPVTGSAHCTLIPFWAERLRKKELFAKQISQRGGELFCRLMGDRVGIAGGAVVYLRGELNV